MMLGAAIVQEVLDGIHGGCSGCLQTGRNFTEGHDEGGIHMSRIIYQSSYNSFCPCDVCCRGGIALIFEGGILYTLVICGLCPFVRGVLGGTWREGVDICEAFM
jgi:hypothetical protein